MPKRKTKNSEVESGVDDDFSPQEATSDDSEYEDAPKTTKRRRTAANSSRTSAKKSGGKARQDLLLVEDGPDSECIEVQHMSSFHAVESSHEILVALLHWFRGVSNNRGMPWRKTYDPLLTAPQRSQRAYEVWVSEIMLQQTRVATVIPYYNAWMQKFPSMDILASSTIDEVNASWKGLGYYSRAARLLAGSQKVVSQYGGVFPTTAKEMEKNIPGIGRYTAGAISSIAYGEHVPVLDGNVHRLLSRFLAIYASPKAKATLDVLWSAADTLVKGTDCIASCKHEDGHVSIHPGDVNQALIELGSTVCRDREPECAICPVRPWCKADYQTNMNSSEAKCAVPDIEDLCSICEPLPRTPDASLYPMRVEKKKPREELDLVSVIEWRPKATAIKDRQFLLVRRPEGGLLAGLMEFPTIPCIETEAGHSKTDRTERGQMHVVELFGTRNSETPFEVTKILRLPKDIVHIFSHIKKTYQVQWIVLSGGTAPPPTTIDNTTARPMLAKTTGKRQSAQEKSRYFAGTETAPRETSWMPIDQVDNANIGTGVSKIWLAAQKLWQ